MEGAAHAIDACDDNHTPNCWKIHQENVWAPMAQPWHTGRPPQPGDASVHCPVSVTAVTPLHMQAAVALAWGGSARSPHPWERAPCWASSHSNLSFRTLSGAHNGPVDHSHPPSPASALLGNGLFLPLLGGGHLRRDQPMPISLLEGLDSSGSGGKAQAPRRGGLWARKKRN